MRGTVNAGRGTIEGAKGTSGSKENPPGLSAGTGYGAGRVGRAVVQKILSPKRQNLICWQPSDLRKPSVTLNPVWSAKNIGVARITFHILPTKDLTEEQREINKLGFVVTSYEAEENGVTP
ncbi:hypothetical protein TNCV_4379611 [Trichonephila clavipes]|nr:hypothetical protein TNCV_4379611 [Trichonephila clavipes]